MNPTSIVTCRRLILPVAALWCCSLAFGQALEQSLQTENQTTREAARVQSQINRLDDETQSLIEEYRRVLSETETLLVYNEQLQRIVNSQLREIESIHAQMERLESTNREVVPLMIEMAKRLDQLIEADLPFRIGERNERAERLVDLLDDSDITNSEKYRLLLEAYQAEIEYGRTTEAYRDSLPDGQQVEFLRIGRTLLFWQSLDGQQTGWFNPTTERFEALDGRYRLAVSDGLAIARNQVAPDLIQLPLPAPTDAEKPR